MLRPIALLALVTSLLGCNWVALTAAGETVSLREASEVSNCERIGRVTSRSREEIATIDRSSERLQNELVTLARNEAGDMGGNVIVPQSVIQDGVQHFAVYNCP